MLALVYGEEDFFVEEKLKGLHSSFPNMRVIDGDAVTEVELLLSLQSSGLFSSQRNCEIRHAPWLVDSGENSFEEAAVEILKSLAPDENVIFSVFGSISHRGALYKYVNAHGEVFDYPALPIWKKDERIRFIKKQAGDRGKTLSDEVAEYIVGVGVTAFRQLAMEIEKLSISVHPAKNISLETAQSLVSPGEAFAWQLADALMQKNSRSSLELLQKLHDAGEAPYALIPMLAKQFRNLLRYKMGMPPADGRLSRGAEWRYRRAAAQFSQAHLESVIRRMVEIDERLKRSSVSPFPLLAAFVTFVAHEK